MLRGSVIAEVLGLTDSTDVFTRSNEATLTLTGNPIDPDNPFPKHDPVTDREDRVDRFLARKMLRGLDAPATTLKDWPSYCRMMKDYGRRAEGAATALMIGSTCAISSRSFVCLAQSEYGAGTHIIVDLVGGRHKARHGSFVYANGLALPLADSSIDFVHTNQLLHQLENPGSPGSLFEQPASRLFAEITRVLTPGGQLLMKEVAPGLLDGNKPAAIEEAVQAGNSLETLVRLVLAECGLTTVEINPTKDYPNLDYLFDPDRNFEGYASLVAGTLDIYARKSD